MVEVENRLAQVLNKDVKIISAQNVGGGCINNAYKIDTNFGAFFLKWNALCASDMFEREAEGLEELARATDDNLLVPDVICFKNVDKTPGYLVLAYLYSRNSVKNFDEMLGRGLAHLHKYKNTHFGFSKNNYCGATPQCNKWNKSWTEFFRDLRIGFLLKLIEKEHGLSSAEKTAYEKLMDRIPTLLSSEAEPSLIHGDLWSGNYMRAQNGPALIDPAAYYAEREMEFAIITMFGGFSQRFFDAYNESYPLKKDWMERNKLYQLYHILNHYYLFGGGYGSQALSVAKSYL